MITVIDEHANIIDHEDNGILDIPQCTEQLIEDIHSIANNDGRPALKRTDKMLDLFRAGIATILPEQCSYTPIARTFAFAKLALAAKVIVPPLYVAPT